MEQNRKYSVDDSNSADGIKFGELLATLFNYKIFILIITFLSFLLVYIYLYFQPSIYSASSMVEVTTYDPNRNSVGDDLLKSAFYSNNIEIDKEIELLKTYDLNKKIIKEMNFQTEVFIKKDFNKKVEIYGDNIPIKIKNISDIDKKIVNKIIKITPEGDNEYSLKIEHNLKEDFSHRYFNKKLLEIDDKNRHYRYGKLIKTKLFSFIIEKKRSNKKKIEFDKPLYLKILGDTRAVYENIIRNRLIVKQVTENAPLIKISYEDNIPERAKEYLNKLAKAFIVAGKENKSRENNKILDFLNKEIASRERKLITLQEDLIQFKINNKVIIEPSSQVDTISKKLSDIEIKLSKNGLKLNMIENIMKILKKGNNINSIGPLLLEVGDNGTYTLVTKLEALELELNKLSSKYTSEYPDVIILSSQIDVLRSKILQNINMLKSSVLYVQRDLKGQRKDLRAELLPFPSKEIRLIELKGKHKLTSTMYEYFLKKREESRVTKKAITSSYKVVEEAYPPKDPIKPKRFFIKFLSIILGLFLGMILALLRNVLSNKIIGQNDIAKNTNLEIYGVIPQVKKFNHTIGVFNIPQSLMSESYRILRTNLQLLSGSKDSKVILVTSSVSNEGKSSIVSNLGAILQLSGAKTIVIDLNLRKPSLHKFFDIENSLGISGYLGGKNNISDIIFSTVHPNLDIIPSGGIPLNPSELILSTRIETILKKLKERYDYILIDSTSIGSFTDTLNLMKYADINLVVFRVNKAKKTYINRLEKMISKYDLKNIGLVVNAVNIRKMKDNNF